tara:strand:+ start:94 stop:453 length:360 start_codon:yes stop_codon:yes gene_type:complete
MSWETILKVRMAVNLAAFKDAVKQVGDSYEAGSVIDFTSRGYDVEEFLDKGMNLYNELTMVEGIHPITGEPTYSRRTSHSKKVFSMNALSGRQRVITSVLLRNGWEKIAPMSKTILRKV